MRQEITTLLNGTLRYFKHDVKKKMTKIKKIMRFFYIGVFDLKTKEQT